MFFANFQSVAPLLIPVLALLIPIIAIVSHYLSRASSERQRHETIRELARAGQPIPPELLADVQDSGWDRARREPPSPNRMLLPALINIGIGFGLMGMFAVMSPGSWLWTIGLLPLFLGLGLALYWTVDRKQPPRP